MPLSHVGCPSCGAALPLVEGQRVVACAYCGRRALAVVPDAIPRYVIPAAIDRAGAAAAARGVLASPGLPSVLRSGSASIRWTLCHVPFYEVTGVRVGAFLQREIPPPPPLPDDDETADAPLVIAPRAPRTDTKVVEQEQVRVRLACALPELGVAAIPLGTMRRDRACPGLVPYDRATLQRSGVVFAPNTPPPAGEAATTVRSRDDHTRGIEERVKLLYYPVWHGRYLHGGRSYTIAVDGVRGTVLRAQAPLDPARAAAVFSALLALGGLAAGRLVRAVVAGSPAGPHLPLEWLLPALLLGAAAGAALVGAAGVWPLVRSGVALGWEGDAVHLDERDEGLLASLARWLVAPGWTRRAGA